MKEIKLILSSDEALVLTDFLLRFQEKESLTIEHKSEEIVLWNLGCVLESTLSELFDPSYSELIESARKNLVAE